MEYRPYSLEWSRKRYLNESIQKYFEDDVSVELILDDIIDILETNQSLYQNKSEKFQKVLDQLKFKF
jgi:hypothetical protein